MVITSLSFKPPGLIRFLEPSVSLYVRNSLMNKLLKSSTSQKISISLCPKSFMDSFCFQLPVEQDPALKI
jgi:hypothetical protein